MTTPQPITNRHLTHALLTLGAAAMLWAAFLPYGLGFMAWVALVPWLVHAAWATPGRAALWSFAGGAAFFLCAMYWLCFVAPPGWVALSLYCAVYWLAGGLLSGWLWRRGCPMVISAPVVVTSLEFIRNGFLTGFSFFFLGHTQSAYLPMIQIADVTGAYGVSFIILAVNGCIADLILSRPVLTRRNAAAAGIVAALVAATAAYGVLRMREIETSPGPRVHMVQANVAQDLKISPSLKDGLEMLKRHIEMSRVPEGKRADLVIWPETSLPAPMNIMLDDAFIAKLKGFPDYKEWAEYLEQCRTEWLRLPKLARAHLLIGAETYYPSASAAKTKRYNSAHFFGPDAEPLGRYDKIHIVVFGEYAPLELLRFLRPPVMGADLNIGMAAEVFELPFDPGVAQPPPAVSVPASAVAQPPSAASVSAVQKATFGVTICYEDADPALFRRFVRNGAQFMVNITNDGWFKDSMELDQHLALCVFRAVENRVGVARDTNTGISAIIGPDGRLLQVLTGPDGRRREVKGTLTGRVPICLTRSFYTQYGDVFAWLCVAGVAALCVWAALRGKPKGDSNA